MIIVHAKLPIQAEKRDEFLAAVPGLVEASNAEAGCQGYRLFEAADTPNEFLMVEYYTDAAAFQSHMSSPHLQAAMGGLGGWLSAPPEIIHYEAEQQG